MFIFLNSLSQNEQNEKKNLKSVEKKFRKNFSKKFSKSEKIFTTKKKKNFLKSSEKCSLSFSGKGRFSGGTGWLYVSKHPILSQLICRRRVSTGPWPCNCVRKPLFLRSFFGSFSLITQKLRHFYLDDVWFFEFLIQKRTK